MTTRAHISIKTKLASALLALGHVPYEHAKLMTADQMLSLYQFDHGILHAIEPNDEFWNLAPVLIAAHRIKSAGDKAIVSKVDRIRCDVAASSARMAAKVTGESITEPRRKSRFPQGRKIQSRGFQRRRM